MLPLSMPAGHILASFQLQLLQFAEKIFSLSVSPYVRHPSVAVDCNYSGLLRRCLFVSSSAQLQSVTVDDTVILSDPKCNDLHTSDKSQLTVKTKVDLDKEQENYN